MAPRKNNSHPTPTMKQSRLSFASKRTSSSAGAAAGKQKLKSATPKSLSRTASSPRPSEPITVEDIDSESDVSFNDDYVVPAAKKRRLNTARAKKIPLGESGNEDHVEEVSAPEPEPVREKLDVSDKRWRKQYGAVREKMGNIAPVHAEGQSMVHHILRVFDLSYEYGPCVGVSRLDRWERAHALGLNPPPEVKEILMTKEGSTDEQFTQSVFHGEV